MKIIVVHTINTKGRFLNINKWNLSTYLMTFVVFHIPVTEISEAKLQERPFFRVLCLSQLKVKY